ncbi:hypothetical protein E2C01_000366 [Portunus trituberculatus]|uniref:Uncharacterized protein n=1 Tax=Portunus trituberculatus TaxID=210409 RepID=A0A5B7CE51_PORTR|nr:hypothetical protein [Portunus trituberculatus]
MRPVATLFQFLRAVNTFASTGKRKKQKGREKTSAVAFPPSLPPASLPVQLTLLGCETNLRKRGYLVFETGAAQRLVNSKVGGEEERGEGRRNHIHGLPKDGQNTPVVELSKSHCPAQESVQHTIVSGVPHSQREGGFDGDTGEERRGAQRRGEGEGIEDT